MKQVFVIFSLLKRDVMFEGSYKTDYKDYSETTYVLERYSFEYESMEAAILELSKITENAGIDDYGEKREMIDEFTILPIFVKA